ncbi:MAG: CoA transferase [Actinomycetota bacterium]|nr:CoA transferase [Actinomycetota bacterium]
MADGILTDIRIVDLSVGPAGSAATMLLAECGADVVKVERAKPGRDRDLPGFRTWNRSKRSLIADIDTPEGLTRLKQLLSAADVFVHELGPTQARAHGLDDASLAQLNPKLIVSSVLGWPMNHADADLPVEASLVHARLGVCDEQLPRVLRDGPIYLRYPLTTWNAVWLAATGIVARLLSRGRSGFGGPAHTSLAQGALVNLGMFWNRGEGMPQEQSNPLPKNMHTPLYECGDGLWLHHMPDLMRSARVRAFVEQHDGPVDEAIVACFLTDTRAAWLQELWASDVPVQGCAEFGEIFDDEQARINGYLVDLDDPQEGLITVVGTPLTLSPPQQIVGPAPAHGAHTEEVLQSWDVSPGPAGDGRKRRWPLEGIKVLDLGSHLAGPYGPQMLADLGADVIKLETTSGDPMRWIGVFLGCQRGKRGIALNLKEPASRAALEAAIGWADVVHHNMRMPAATRLGLDAKTVREINPTVIYCHTSSYGPTGPRADWPGFDQLFQALSGWETLAAGDGNPPMWHRFGFMDHHCATSSALAVVLALYHRDRTGVGQDVAASLLGSGLLTVSEIFKGADGTLPPFPGLSADQLTRDDGHRILQQADGWVMIAADEPVQLAALGALNLTGCTVAEALSVLATAGVPAEQVRLDQMNAFFDSEDNRAAGLVSATNHALWGTILQPGGLWSFGDQEIRMERAAPVLGEHTVECLREFGLKDQVIEDLLASGAAVQHA